MEQYTFSLRETNVSLKSVMSGINEVIRLRREAGVYEHVDLSEILKLSLNSIRDKNKYLEAHLETIKYSWAVDINDFKIIRKHKGIKGYAEFLLKKIIWNLLKFYTYRLFSQQREYNLQLSHAALYMEKNYMMRIQKLQEELELLKKIKK